MPEERIGDDERRSQPTRIGPSPVEIRGGCGGVGMLVGALSTRRTVDRSSTDVRSATADRDGQRCCTAESHMQQSIT